MRNRTLVAIAASIVIAAAGVYAADHHHDDEANQADQGHQPDDGHHADDGQSADEGHHADQGHHGGMAMMAGVGEAGRAEDVARTVAITTVDNYFLPESLEVAAGETVRFVVTNEGELLHEFNIGTAAMHLKHQEEMMTMFEHGMIEMDRINHDMMDMDMGDGKMMSHDDPNSVLLEPGQTAEIIWKFTDGGNLEFACNIPGHYDAGMMGEITVTR